MDVKIFYDDIKFKYRVSAIFIYDNKLLVNKYDDDSYCLPGGYVEIGETSEEAIKRELMEEINLNFNIDSFAGITENFFVNIRGEKTHGLDFYYKVSLKDPNDISKIDYERVENDKEGIVYHHLKWIDIKELNKIKLLPLVIRDDITSNVKNFHHIIK